MEKAALFADVFDNKQSNDGLTMPQSCFPEAELTTLCKLRNYCLNLILMVVVMVLVAFFFFFIETADYLAPKISTIFFANSQSKRS